MSETVGPDAGAAGVSIGPPGAPPAPPPIVSRPVSTTAGPHAALRARANAAVVDNVLTCVIAIVLVVAFGARGAAATCVFLVVSLAYHFVLESRDGQTLGKRNSKVRVVDADGGAATPKAILIRNLLRPIDAIPIFYASGIISMALTGPDKRQRIGDRVAGTVVVSA